ncbi:MAG: hypothetical protein AAF990_07205 [Bacteroidota bacterium]
MKNIIGFVAIIIGGYFVHQYLPWWSIAVVSAIVCAWMGQSGWKNFLLGFFGAALLWGIIAVMIDQANSGLLSAKMGQLLGGLSGGLMILVTAIIGGLAGGLGGLTGGFAAQLGNSPKHSKSTAS